MAVARVPKVDTGGEGVVAGGGGGVLNGVEGIARAITSVEEHASTAILHKKNQHRQIPLLQSYHKQDV